MARSLEGGRRLDKAENGNYPRHGLTLSVPNAGAERDVSITISLSLCAATAHPRRIGRRGTTSLPRNRAVKLPWPNHVRSVSRSGLPVFAPVVCINNETIGMLVAPDAAIIVNHLARSTADSGVRLRAATATGTNPDRTQRAHRLGALARATRERTQ